MAQYYLAIRTLKTPSALDLNSEAVLAQNGDASVGRKMTVPYCAVKSPFWLGQSKELGALDSTQADEFISKIIMGLDDSR